MLGMQSAQWSHAVNLYRLMITQDVLVVVGIQTLCQHISLEDSNLSSPWEMRPALTPRT